MKSNIIQNSFLAILVNRKETFSYKSYNTCIFGILSNGFSMTVNIINPSLDFTYPFVVFYIMRTSLFKQAALQIYCIQQTNTVS